MNSPLGPQSDDFLISDLPHLPSELIVEITFLDFLLTLLTIGTLFLFSTGCLVVPFQDTSGTSVPKGHF